MKTCENCGREHDGSYGSGRFCSTKCSRGFSTKAKRQEINEKVSKKLRLSDEEIENRNLIKRASFFRENEATSILDLSNRTVFKIIRRMKLSCSICNWYHENVVCDIHHIIQKKYNGTNNMNNLTYICPNCHRLVHSGIIDSNELVSLEDYIGDTWKKYYYVKSSRIYEK